MLQATGVFVQGPASYKLGLVNKCVHEDCVSQFACKTKVLQGQQAANFPCALLSSRIVSSATNEFFNWSTHMTIAWYVCMTCIHLCMLHRWTSMVQWHICMVSICIFMVQWHKGRVSMDVMVHCMAQMSK